MSTMTALSRAEFTLLGRNRVLLFNAIVMPLIFPIALLIVGSRSDDGLTDAGVGAALEIFALFLLVFMVYYNMLSVYATRRDELVLKRLRTGESSDVQILLGPAIPSLILTVVLGLIVGAVVLAFGGPVPTNALLVVAALFGGAALFAALALITSAFTRNAEAAQITSLPVILVAMAGSSLLRDALPDSFGRVIELTPMAAVSDLLNLGWFGTTSPGDASAGFAATFTEAGMPLLVMLAWIVGSLLIARTHFRWEPRS
ncbi:MULTISPECIES: ABC transporter permease [unclassified Rhodococcus (in: high G+C Gram-positive bacteria)]|uniref:ABC transporter permease n=1 Tax=unclassified Rhodococcus (in: high G+C Gram-positive bacteria) TaxID=192944 RepID=UPI0007BADEF0|nr:MULTISPECIES: ABC transporter permease [unclassified Rhodococcus (in: high G+C Gram-positive bacteria)]KZF04618.1 ABC transporter permease [Rhodococcus sp. EPR-279]KZF08612.1 ABC transporter permease [Rhodococcus sp. EPR-147]OZE37134.1 ABC transporter permease [Rhodococcus sp. 05-2254-4]OZE44806.1 ABC transporter permease [Rhodococcus sp. 05-2254-3]OZE45260.1 ABC transporter permease [Rhodococcus sp. 05-2254-2]